EDAVVDVVADRAELHPHKLTRAGRQEAVMEIQPKKPSRKGPAEMFTGEVWLDPIATPQPPASFSVSAVHFSPGARTAWHSHSHGQTLHVTDGEGLIQSRGDAIHSIGAGDTIH